MCFFLRKKKKNVEWPPIERVDFAEYMKTSWLITNVLISIVVAFPICFGLSYPFLAESLATHVFDNLNLSFIVTIPMFTPISIAMFEPLIAFHLSRARHLIHSQCSDQALSQTHIRFLFPFVRHPNQLLSSLIYGFYLTILTAWLALGAMYVTYQNHTFGRMALSLWASGYCTLISIPSAIYVSLASVTESAFQVYQAGVCRAYWACSIPSQDPTNESAQEKDHLLIN